MDAWTLRYEGFEAKEEKLREALCTLGNGYFCTRGAAAESAADEVHYPGTYLAGGYDRLETDIAGRTIENEDLVNLPNWLCLQWRIDGGEWFDLRQVKILDYLQELDLRRGVLQRRVRFMDAGGRICLLSEQRLVHMARLHLGAQKACLIAENWSGRLEVRSALDGRVKNDNVKRYRDLDQQHLVALEARPVDEETLFLKVSTRQSELRAAMSCRTRMFMNGRLIRPDAQLEETEGFIARRFALELRKGERLGVEKTLALCCSRDTASAECGLDCRRKLARAPGFDALLESHRLAWKHLWQRFGLELSDHEGNGTGRTLMMLRLHLFHLLQSVSMHSMDLDVGVPARGWHGEAYRGHVFWDELFIFPLLNLRVPEITRTLLRYRHRRLEEARAAALEAGLRGAMFPWQSGSDGREESQELHLNPRSDRWIADNSRLQRHVNAAIAWNVWTYYQVTCDLEFLSFYGAEMILEIARFWASLASWNEEHARFEILGVMGPDEYHDGYPWREAPGIDNNAYTNLMAVWVLKCALKVLALLPQDRSVELRETIALSEEEIELWERVSRKMRIPFHGEGIISQFEGYEKLEELDWKHYRSRHGKVMRLDRILEAENDSPNRYRCSKQADVLMLFYLFSAEELQELFERLDYPFDPEWIPRNIHYYLQRTSHGSTLSQIVHSWVLSRSDRQRSWELFTLALRSDIDDIQGGTTPEGIHLGAMAGTLDLIQRGYTGIETRGEHLNLNPCLPEVLSRLCLHIRYRGHTLKLEMGPKHLCVTSLYEGPAPIRIAHCNQVRELAAGGQLRFEVD